MTLDPKLLNILACPECKVDVVYRRVDKTEELICPECKRVFQVTDGIPQMMPKESKHT